MRVEFTGGCVPVAAAALDDVICLLLALRELVTAGKSLPDEPGLLGNLDRVLKALPER